MVKRPRKNSGRTKILEIIGRHPNGLNAAKIRELVSREHTLSEQHIASILVHLCREGRLINDSKHSCPSCALRSVIYKPKQLPLPL